MVKESYMNLLFAVSALSIIFSEFPKRKFAEFTLWSLRLQLAFTGVVYPSLLIGYIGQAAYLSKHLDEYEHAFFRSVPG